MPFPTEWIITPDDPLQRAECPQPRETIFAFLITNAVVTVVGLLVGFRPLVRRMTCHKLAKPGEKNVYLCNWIPVVGMNLAANALCGYIIKRTPGYGHTKVRNVRLLYLQRPRIAVLVTTAAAWLVSFQDEHPWIYS